MLAPCGVCQERLATHGPEVLAAVPGAGSDLARWVPLKNLMPHYWATAFVDGSSEWTHSTSVA